MGDCIFCQIVKGKIPCYKIYEDKDFLGFLDIYPLNPGHALLIPRKHYRWVNQVSDFGKYWEIAGELSQVIERVLKADHSCFITLGQEVAHAHIHIVPRYPEDDLGGTIDWSKKKKIDKEKMKEISKNIFQEVSKLRTGEVRGA